MSFVLKYVAASGQKVALVDGRRPTRPFSDEVYLLGPSGQGYGPHMDITGDASGQGIYWSPEDGPAPENPLGLRVFPSRDASGNPIGPGSPAYQAWFRECQEWRVVDAAQAHGQSIEEYLTRMNLLPADAGTLAAIRQIPPVAAPAPGSGADAGADSGPFAVGGPGGVGHVGTMTPGSPAQAQPHPLIVAFANAAGLTVEEYMARYGTNPPPSTPQLPPEATKVSLADVKALINRLVADIAALPRA